jgi:hypothetical protein
LNNLRGLRVTAQGLHANRAPERAPDAGMFVAAVVHTSRPFGAVSIVNNQRNQTMMKNATKTLGGLALLGTLLIAPQVLAQAVEERTETTTTTTTKTMNAGTVSTFGNDQIAIRTTPSAAPVIYQYTETTTYVDEAGRPVSVETVKSGTPVVVHFTKDGDRMVATKVVVKKTTTTMPPRG